MTVGHYERVLPRDLFNEANLLKNLGRLFLLLDDAQKDCTLVHEYSDRPFCIAQDDSSGAITCSNIYLLKGKTRHYLWRPLNSRQPWPLFIMTEDEDVINVFHQDSDEGIITGEFAEFIGYGRTS